MSKHRAVKVRSIRLRRCFGETRIAEKVQKNCEKCAVICERCKVNCEKKGSKCQKNLKIFSSLFIVGREINGELPKLTENFFATKALRY
jgi:hypothetical protein